MNEFSRAGLFLHSSGDLHFISFKLPSATELGWPSIHNMGHPGKGLGWDRGGYFYLFIWMPVQFRWGWEFGKAKRNQSKTLISLLKNEGMENTEGKRCRKDFLAPSQLQGGCSSTRAGREATGKEGRSNQGLSLSPALCRTLGQSLLLSSLCSLHSSLTLRSVFGRAVAVWILLLLFVTKKEARCF